MRNKRERGTSGINRTNGNYPGGHVSVCSVFSACSAFSVFLSLVLVLPCAIAQTTSENTPKDDTPATTPTPAPSTSWQWSFTIRNRTGLRTESPRVWQMSRTIAEAKGVGKLSENWRLTVQARAHVDPVQRLGYPHNVWIDPRQVLLDDKAGKVDLKLGLQQIVWGQADGLRVLDVINPLDYREFILEDFLDSRRPLWAARADAPIAGGTLQGVWIPYFLPARLPVGKDEFSFGESFGPGLLDNAQTSAAPRPDVKVQPTTRPANKLSASQGGVRYSRTIGTWDLGANYFYGWEDTPTPYLSLQPGVPPAPFSIAFAPRHDRKQVMGMTGVNNFGPVVLRLEAGWNRNKSAAVTSGSLTGFRQYGQFSSVVGLDYSPREWLTLSGQYFLQFTAAPQSALILPRNNHLASLYIRTNFFRDTFRPELFVLTGLNRRQSMLRPRLTKLLNDNWSIGAGGDFLGGRNTTIFGYFQDRDRAVIELKWMK
ncbi:MAG: DUF1302 family protein [Blastocatellia bacterium]